MKSNHPFRAPFVLCSAVVALSRPAAAQVAAGTCAAGRADCDADAANGCETTLANAAAHCGACGHACGVGLVCDGGACRHDEVQHLIGHRMVRTARGMACVATDSGRTAVRRTTLTPLPLPGIADAVQLAAGEEHSCVVRATGGVACWGAGRAGQLGDGHADALETHPVVVSGLVDAVQVAAGVTHTCARRASGAVVCWGGEQFGQLGRNASGMDAVTTPVVVSTLVDAVDIAAGGYTSCAVRRSGAVACWGRNERGQLGDGTRTDRATPVTVQGIADAVTVSVGAEHACAVRRGGDVMCWGFNNNGQLGDGTQTDRATAHRVRNVSDATGVSAGEYHTCALRSGGGVVCWGWDLSGGLGDGGRVTRSLPVDASGVHGAVQIRAAGNHSCARLADGHVWCWGANGFGEAGNGSIGPSAVAGPVSWLDDARDIALGAGYACARRATGAIVCWGRGDGGGPVD